MAKPTTMLTVLHFPKHDGVNLAPTTKVKSKISGNREYAKTYYKSEISQKGLDREASVYYCTK